MVIAYPWSGRDWNRTIAISGRAAMPGLPNGSGFNWRSVAGTTGMMRPRGRGFGALGQDSTTMPTDLTDTWTDGSTSYGIDASGQVWNLDTGQIALGSQVSGASGSSTVTQGASGSSNQAPWYASLISSAVNIGGQITNYELNPLLNKQTYMMTPQGMVIATNNPNFTGTGLTSATASSLFPLLLLGGGVVVVMMMAKR